MIDLTDIFNIFELFPLTSSRESPYFNIYLTPHSRLEHFSTLSLGSEKDDSSTPNDFAILKLNDWFSLNERRVDLSDLIYHDFKCSHIYCFDFHSHLQIWYSHCLIDIHHDLRLWRKATTTKPPHKMNCWLSLNVVIVECLTILKLFSGKN